MTITARRTRAMSGAFNLRGKMWLAEAGLYHYKARWYDPEAGRFLQTDPIGYGDGLNMYAYVGNDPVNGRDPSGYKATKPEVPISKYTTGHDGYFSNEWGIADEIVVTGTRSDWSLLEYYGSSQAVIDFWAVRIANENRADGGGGRGGDEGHDYRTRNKVCDGTLTVSHQKDLLSRFAVPAGGLVGKPIGNGVYWVTSGGSNGGAPIGRVRTTFDEDGLGVTNVTLFPHPFAGSIRREFAFGNGASYITTHGAGNAKWLGQFRDNLNQSKGPGIFNDLDARAADYARANYKECKK